MIKCQNYIYLYVRRGNLDSLTKNRKEHAPQGDDASTAEAAPSRVRRGELDEAHQANTTPNGGPHLELGHLRLKPWSKSDSSIAQTTWPTYLYMYLGTLLMFSDHDSLNFQSKSGRLNFERNRMSDERAMPTRRTPPPLVRGLMRSS